MVTMTRIIDAHRQRAPLLLLPLFLALSLPAALHAQTRAADRTQLRERLQQKLDSLHRDGRFAGATAAIALDDGTVITLATGQSDTASHTPMRPTDLMLAGSTGKTFFAALALQLVHEKRITLDDPLSRYLGDAPWWRAADGRTRLPNGDDITLRMLMNHTSGIVRYEFNPAFTSALSAEPYREWSPAEQIAFVLDTEPPFPAGQGWDYSDTNYILLALALEKATGQRAYDMIRTRLLEPLRLTRTVPSTSPHIDGLVQGYAGANNPFGGADAVLADGRLTFNPAFEWAGGGFATTTEDLARWAKALYEGRAFDPALMTHALDGIPAPALGRGVSYGLGVIIRDSPLGPAWGHSGFFPGYLTDMRYFPEHRIAVAVQVNNSDGRTLGRPLGAIAQDIAQIAVEGSR